MSQPLRFGAFIPPLQRPNQSPTLALERCVELAEWCDRIGYDEVWFGEHHNGGWELIPCPELMIAAVAQRTKHVKLGTGVISLPYHHPFMVAERLVFLDHLTRGRVILGVGPGSLAFDAHIMGIDYAQNRRRTGEALEAIMRLLEDDEPVTMETDWFTLRDAELHLKPFTYPRFEVTATGTSSPVGPRLAGKHGISLLTLAAGSADGFAALPATWGIVEEEAAKHGKIIADRSGWRLVSFYHIAETDEQAREDARYGLKDLLMYLGAVTPLADLVSDLNDHDRMVDELNDSDLMVIGSPKRLIDHIRRLEKQTGGFGGFLGFGHEIADRAQTMRSHELVMRDVAPVFKRSTERQQANFTRLTSIATDWSERVVSAQEAATKQYNEERARS